MEAQAARLPAALGLLAIALAAATPQHGVIVEKNVPAAMRDGTILRADIYRPDAPGRFPALLQRTPYSKNTSGGRARSESLSAKGYVVVIQDTRGRYTSDGIARQHDEAEDGYDTVEWVASLPFVDGRVGMFGGSYLATTQLMAATLAPPRLVALFPSSSYASRYDMVFQGGAFYLGDGLAWNLGQAADVRRRILDPTADRDGPLGLTREQRRLLRERWLWHLPLKTMDALELSRFAPGYRLMLEHSSYDEFWETFDIAARHDRFEVAALHVTGWYDTLRNFSGLRANARTERGRAGQRLIVGPWTHSGPTPASTSIGDVDFGPDAGLDARGLMEHGRLTTTAPGAELPDRFLYDPSDPVPTLGMSGYSRAPADQRQLEEWRADNSQPGPAERPPASPHAYGALGLGRLANALREPRAQPHLLRRSRRRWRSRAALSNLGYHLAGLQSVRWGQHLRKAGPRRPRPARLQGQLQPSLRDPRLPGGEPGLQRRVPDGALAGGERLRRSWSFVWLPSDGWPAPVAPSPRSGSHAASASPSQTGGATLRILSRAVDDSANLESPGSGVTVTMTDGGH